MTGMVPCCVIAALLAGESPLQERDLFFTVEVPLSIEAAWGMWLTPARARDFLAAEVRIEPWVGGRYETIFDPEADPAGARAGTYGSKIVAMDAPRRLVFEWESLTPEAAAAELGGERVLQKSEVEVVFEPRGVAATTVRIHHYGFGDGTHWDASYRFYRDRGWPWILRRLEALFAGAEFSVAAPARD